MLRADVSAACSTQDLWLPGADQRCLWKKFAPKYFQEDYVWFVINHTIDYKAASFEGEKLKLTTWIAKNEGVRSERHYKIVRIKDQKVIVEAKTTWCLLNGKTLRPTKITEEISTLFD